MTGLSPEYRQFRQTNNVTNRDAQAVLSKEMRKDSALIEYRFFNPFNFKTRQTDELHLLAVILGRDEPPLLIDWGKAAPIIEMQQQMINELGKKERAGLPTLKSAAYDILIAPLMPHLTEAKTLIISPDGQLNALPFDILINEKWEAFAEARIVRLVQSGRDLIADRKITGKGLVAFGGIDFGKPDIHARGPSATAAVQVAQFDQGDRAQRTLDIFHSTIGPFKPLMASGEEVDLISEFYEDHSACEPKPVKYVGRAATEAQLKALSPAPRVLHLATHGFYLANKGALAGQPLLQSGVTMALAFRVT